MLYRTKIAILFSVLFLKTILIAQNAQVDSLIQYVNTAKDDTVKVKTLINISFKMRTTNPKAGLEYAQEAIDLSKAIGWKPGIGKGYNSLGTNYKALSEYTKALESYQRGLTIAEDLNSKKEIAIFLMNIGSIYRPLHDFDKALDHYKKALVIAEQINEKKTIAQLYGNMGVVYFEIGNYTEQLAVNEKALKIFREIKDIDNESWILSNLGDLYAVQGDFEKALETQKTAIKLYDQMGNLSYKSSSLDNIGMYYFQMAQKETNTEKRKKWLKSSIEYYNQAAEILKEINDIDYLKQVYLNLSNSQILLGDYKSALENSQIYNNLKDSIFSIEAKESVANLETQRELEVKDKEIVIQQLKKRTERIYMFAGVLFLLVIIGFIAAGYRSQKRSKEMISVQKNIVEEKQKEIVDSINYAKRIQYALLAHHEFLNEHLPDHFVLFKPKDIVSGDFYWATATADHFYLAVCDSTGHGVPGAFMSLLSISFLNEAINEKRITEPDQVFNFVRSRLIDNISGEGQKDGFDGILICLDKKNKKLSYAAANNAPVLVRNSTITKLENDRMPVGAGEKTNSFRLFNIQLEQNDCLYLYTDGFSDQFGGPAGKKFMSKNLNNLILDIHEKPPKDQQELLFASFNKWKGQLDQVDDICLIGLKI
ncbi:MAG: protein serine/threonine phosphatase [Bacteroidetes bacterium]|jgi:serine phosphatase RsbU (regulator of sigma subunit)|nr:protein serine/threonine phosphatase [Bacteroidota bacterium]